MIQAGTQFFTGRAYRICVKPSNGNNFYMVILSFIRYDEGDFFRNLNNSLEAYNGRNKDFRIKRFQ